ncbi:transcriptional regulator, XRE family with cupin sensor [Thermanaeromonas toyohensis ToBE]|uniref:Transcriptional regulator, XRE family with cupin sensor n=1 Tax=Thermanaeromonas toyohensis ToBE TaxID=698762 RepID=A0A1W1VFE6_9FIRM|nr:XRE family transcriptional regulator [Thermanaeromonas toyohensis]SMB91940.1 transcriptional regulator, XRE family with cupin sensor [Thermanaeromonas toyohensis ToBE]
MLGARIREIRQEKGLRLEKVAKKAGLTCGFLSQVERDLANPSITSLRKIAEALDVPIFYLLLDHKGLKPVVRRDQRKVLRFPQSGVTYELLCPELNRKMEVMIGRVDPSAVSCEEPLFHPGEECIVVLQGCMGINIGGEVYRLEKGDSIYYCAAVPHKLWNPGDKELVFLSAVTPPLWHC